MTTLLRSPFLPTQARPQQHKQKQQLQQPRFKLSSTPGRLERAGLTPLERVRAPAPKKDPRPVLAQHKKLIAALGARERQARAARDEAGRAREARGAALRGFAARLRAGILGGEQVGAWWPAAAGGTAQRGDGKASTAQAAACSVEAAAPRLARAPAAERTPSPGSCDGGAGFRPHPTVAREAAAAAARAASEQRGAASEQRGAASGGDGGSTAAGSGDVEAFLDSLMLGAGAPPGSGGKQQAAAPAGSANDDDRGGAPSPRPEPRPAPASRPQTAARAQRPAWALTETAAAAAAAAAEAAAEEELLAFAEGLDWERFIEKVEDPRLAAALEELRAADAARGGGTSAAVEGGVEAAAGEGSGSGGGGDGDREARWRRSFVRALNLAKGFAGGQRAPQAAGSNDGGGGSAGGGGGGAAALLHKLRSLGLGGGAAEAAAPAGPPEWDASTRVGDAEGQGEGGSATGSGGGAGGGAALGKGALARELLALSPAMRAVHSALSARGVLERRRQAGAGSGGGGD